LDWIGFLELGRWRNRDTWWLIVMVHPVGYRYIILPRRSLSRATMTDGLRWSIASTVVDDAMVHSGQW